MPRKIKQFFSLVKASVHTSMKKTQYEVYVNLYQETAKVSLASCSCKVDHGGCCKHVAALLFQLLDFIQLEATEVRDDLTCTHLLQQWHVLSGQEMKTAVLFNQVKFSKATKQTNKLCTRTTHQHTMNIACNPAPLFSIEVKASDIEKIKR